MHIEAVTICVNYADMLRLTLPFIKDQFDDLLVVTTPEDERTIALCRQEGVRYHCSEKVFQRGCNFNKGGAINDGFTQLKRNGWVALLDCDIVIPFELKRVLEKLSLEKNHLHSMPRYMMKNYKDFLRWQSGTISLTAFPFSLAIGLGYLQLFHPDSRLLRDRDPAVWYPEGPGADRIDFEFIHQWPKIEVIEKYLIHLGQLELNWAGRRTESFFDDPMLVTTSTDHCEAVRVKRVQAMPPAERNTLLAGELIENYGNVVAWSQQPLTEDTILDLIRQSDITFTRDESVVILQSNVKTHELLQTAARKELSLLEVITHGMLRRYGILTGGLRYRLIDTELNFIEL